MPEEELLNENSKEFASFEYQAPYAQEDETAFRQGEDNHDEDNHDEDEPMIYAALKGVFFTPKADNAGVFCIIYNGNTGKVIFRELWAIRSDKRPASDISDRWESFIKDMNKIGAYDKEPSEKWLPVIVQSLSNGIKDYLFKNIGETDNAHLAIRQALEKVLHYAVDLDICVELTGETRVEKGGILRGGKDEPDSAQPAEEDNEAIMGLVKMGEIPLICEPVINPVNGCPVSNLQAGDVVHVMIPETNDIAKKVMDYLRVENEIPAFPVYHIQPLESGKCAVLLRINDQITGVLNLSPDVMLKTNVTRRKESLTAILKKYLLNSAALLLGGLAFFIVLLLYFITRVILN